MLWMNSPFCKNNKRQMNDIDNLIVIGDRVLVKPSLDSVSGLCNVSFEPSCRNNWHVHHGATQILICVSGRGWYQEWSKPAVELKPGVTIAVPEGVKHWHGAAKDSWMQHLTYHANAKPGNSNEWLEPVTDEQYNTMQ